MQTQPAEPKEDHDARPEYPLILPRPLLDHANGVARDAQRVGDRVQPLLRVLQHVLLRAQVAEHGLPPRDVLVQRVVRAGEEVLLPQRVLFPRQVVAPHQAVPVTTTTTTPHARAAARVPRMPAAAAAIAPIRTGRGCRAGGAAGVGVLGRGAHVRPPAQQLVPALAVERLVARALEGLEVLAVLGQLVAEIADALVRLLLLRGVELLLRQGIVLVDRPLEGCEGGAEGAQGGGADDRGGGGLGLGL